MDGKKVTSLVVGVVVIVLMITAILVPIVDGISVTKEIENTDPTATSEYNHGAIYSSDMSKDFEIKLESTGSKYNIYVDSVLHSSSDIPSYAPKVLALFDTGHFTSWEINSNLSPIYGTVYLSYAQDILVSFDHTTSTLSVKYYKTDGSLGIEETTVVSKILHLDKNGDYIGYTKSNTSSLDIWCTDLNQIYGTANNNIDTKFFMQGNNITTFSGYSADLSITSAAVEGTKNLIHVTGANLDLTQGSTTTESAPIFLLVPKTVTYKEEMPYPGVQTIVNLIPVLVVTGLIVAVAYSAIRRDEA